MRHIHTILTLLLLATSLACGAEEDTGSTTKQPSTKDVVDMAKAPDLAPEVDMAKPEVDMAMPEVDMAKPEPMCKKEDESFCGDRCTNITFDEKNCGGCGEACGRGAGCESSKCFCLDADLTWCEEGVCTDTQNDTRHCGECGNKCGAASYCEKGECIEGGVLAEVLLLTNEARSTPTKCGNDPISPAVPPLGFNKELAVAAQGHSEDMYDRGFFAHDAPEPKASTATQRMRAAGYKGRATGENIAQGQPTPKAVVDAWIKSPGHCRNIMRAGFTELGVGYHRGGNGKKSHYWTQNFGAP